MIGLVIVSHSAKLAEGVCELARQVARDKVKIAAAGGTADPQNPIGTDAFQVLQAIESVYSEEGVLVLMDLGSAVLSAETALELLGERRLRWWREPWRLPAWPLPAPLWRRSPAKHGTRWRGKFRNWVEAASRHNLRALPNVPDPPRKLPFRSPIHSDCTPGRQRNWSAWRGATGRT
jgi:dihydroxyacetone kinase phosphotransfer subunit